MLFQSQANSQSFPYLHWEEEHNEFTAEIIKYFDWPGHPPNNQYPGFWFKNSRGGKSDIIPWIDYITDDGQEYSGGIYFQFSTPDSMVTPIFNHLHRGGPSHSDTLMLVKADNNKVYRIELQKMSLSDYKSRTVPAKVKITVVREGSGGGGNGGGNTGTQWSEEQRTICAGTTIPSGWIIQRREPCFSCPSRPGSACLQSVIVNLNGAPAGYEKLVCPGSTVPVGWAIIGQQLCVGACGDQAGSTCVQQKIKNLSGMPAGTQVALCPGSPVPASWTKVSTQSCGGLCSDRAGQTCIMTIYRK